MTQTGLFDYYKSYHNTTNLKDKELREAEEKAETQEQIILAFFIRRAPSCYMPCEVHRTINIGLEHPWPLTSVRRAITNLTKRGTLQKTDVKKIGLYGKLTYCWRLARPKTQEG